METDIAKLAREKRITELKGVLSQVQKIFVEHKCSVAEAESIFKTFISIQNKAYLEAAVKDLPIEE